MSSAPQPQPSIPVVVSVIGSHGSTDGSFLGPFGVTLSGANEVIGVDDISHRISIFDVRGSFVRGYGKRGTASGELSFPDAVWVDEQNDRLYIADTGNNRIQVWDRTGRFLRTFGKAVFGSSLANPRDVLVAPNGEIFV